MLLLNYYSTLPNKQTGSLSENERKFPPIVSSPSKLKNPTYIFFFLPNNFKKAPTAPICVFGTIRVFGSLCAKNEF